MVSDAHPQPAPEPSPPSGRMVPPPGSVTVYATSWCPFCRRLRVELDRAGVSYDEIDIDRDPQAAAYVESVNRGDRTVPTVLFPDGSTLTNPPATVVASVVQDR